MNVSHLSPSNWSDHSVNRNAISINTDVCTRMYKVNQSFSTYWKTVFDACLLQPASVLLSTLSVLFSRRSHVESLSLTLGSLTEAWTCSCWDATVCCLGLMRPLPLQDGFETYTWMPRRGGAISGSWRGSREGQPNRARQSWLFNDIKKRFAFYTDWHLYYNMKLIHWKLWNLMQRKFNHFTQQCKYKAKEMACI